MITQEFIENFKVNYEENQHKLDAWNKRLLDEMSTTDWVTLLSHRSVAIRRIYRENDALLKELWDNIPTELDQSTILLLYELIYSMFKDNLHDFTILSNIGELILPYFEYQKEYAHMLFLYHMLGYEYTIFYRLHLDSTGADVALDYYRKSIAMRKHYAKIKDRSTRAYVFLDFSNLCRFIKHFKAGSFSECYAIVEKARKFALSPVAQACEEDQTFITQYLAKMDRVLLDMAKLSAPLSTEDKKRFFRVISRVNEHYANNADQNILFYLLAEYYKGSIPIDQLLDELSRRLEANVPKIDYANDQSNSALVELVDYINLASNALEVLRTAELPTAQKEAYTQRVIQPTLRLITEIPYQFRTEVMNSVFAEWYTTIEPFLKTDDEKIDLLLRLIIRRQPITYIHSMMVAKIAELLTAEVLAKCPEELIGVLGCQTKEDVLEHNAELSEYIYHCGILHDVGKCYITDIINKQNRKLSDSEIEMIKLHPDFGLMVAHHDSVLAPYYDVIQGHHKTYDGKGGYPESFDNTASPIRFVIDLISIADSMDAATDVLGRNYTAGKDFPTLFEELKAEAGTRYNPRIIQLIKDNKNLQQTLSYLTLDGRYEVYYQAYKDIRGSSST